MTKNNKLKLRIAFLSFSVVLILSVIIIPMVVLIPKSRVSGGSSDNVQSPPVSKNVEIIETFSDFKDHFGFDQAETVLNNVTIKEVVVNGNGSNKYVGHEIDDVPAGGNDNTYLYSDRLSSWNIEAANGDWIIVHNGLDSRWTDAHNDASFLQSENLSYEFASEVGFEYHPDVEGGTYKVYFSNLSSGNNAYLSSEEDSEFVNLTLNPDEASYFEIEAGGNIISVQQNERYLPVNTPSLDVEDNKIFHLESGIGLEIINDGVYNSSLTSGDENFSTIIVDLHIPDIINNFELDVSISKFDNFSSRMSVFIDSNDLVGGGSKVRLYFDHQDSSDKVLTISGIYNLNSDPNYEIIEEGEVNILLSSYLHSEIPNDGVSNFPEENRNIPNRVIPYSFSVGQIIERGLGEIRYTPQLMLNSNLTYSFSADVPLTQSYEVMLTYDNSNLNFGINSDSAANSIQELSIEIHDEEKSITSVQNPDFEAQNIDFLDKSFNSLTNTMVIEGMYLNSESRPSSFLEEITIPGYKEILFSTSGKEDNFFTGNGPGRNERGISVSMVREDYHLGGIPDFYVRNISNLEGNISLGSNVPESFVHQKKGIITKTFRGEGVSTPSNYELKFKDFSTLDTDREFYLADLSYPVERPANIARVNEKDFIVKNNQNKNDAEGEITVNYDLVSFNDFTRIDIFKAVPGLEGVELFESKTKNNASGPPGIDTAAITRLNNSITISGLPNGKYYADLQNDGQSNRFYFEIISLDLLPTVENGDGSADNTILSYDNAGTFQINLELNWPIEVLSNLAIEYRVVDSTSSSLEASNWKLLEIPLNLANYNQSFSVNENGNYFVEISIHNKSRTYMSEVIEVSNFSSEESQNEVTSIEIDDVDFSSSIADILIYINSPFLVDTGDKNFEFAVHTDQNWVSETKTLVQGANVLSFNLFDIFPPNTFENEEFYNLYLRFEQKIYQFPPFYME